MICTLTLGPNGLKVAPCATAGNLGSLQHAKEHQDRKIPRLTSLGEQQLGTRHGRLSVLHTRYFYQGVRVRPTQSFGKTWATHRHGLNSQSGHHGVEANWSKYVCVRVCNCGFISIANYCCMFLSMCR